MCKAGHFSHCESFNDLNFGGPHRVFSLASKSGEPEVGGAFFGQSSFANLSIVRQCSVVNAKDLVKDKHEPQMFAPLGCGIQTGAGTVINAAEAKENDTVLVMGLGGVGLSAGKYTPGQKVCAKHRRFLTLYHSYGCEDCRMPQNNRA